MSNPPVVETDATGGFGAASYERPVPRISIDAFCEFPDTLGALEHAATDRRLSKAHVNVQSGGVAGRGPVLRRPSHAQSDHRGNARAGRRGDRASWNSLPSVCDETTKVVVVGRANDVQLYRELTRRGVSEYLVAPLNTLQIIETIANLYVTAKAPPIGRVVVFAGARGGVGASTLAHNVGWCIAEGLKIDTAIIDFDLAFGTVGLNFNEDTGQGVADALAAPERLDDVLLDRLLIKCGDRLSLFAAPALLDRDYDIETSAYEAVVDQVRRSIPCVMVDLPHAWTPVGAQHSARGRRDRARGDAGSGVPAQHEEHAGRRARAPPQRCGAEARDQPVRHAQASRDSDQGIRRGRRPAACTRAAVRSAAVRDCRQQRPDACRGCSQLRPPPKASASSRA